MLPVWGDEYINHFDIDKHYLMLIYIKSHILHF